MRTCKNLSTCLTVHSLSAFYDHIETSIRGLESLGQNHESYGALLTIIFRKLPADLRKSITREHNWDINSLRKAINKVLQEQDAGQMNIYDEVTQTASYVTKQ